MTIYILFSEQITTKEGRKKVMHLRFVQYTCAEEILSREPSEG